MSKPGGFGAWFEKNQRLGTLQVDPEQGSGASTPTNVISGATSSIFAGISGSGTSDTASNTSEWTFGLTTVQKYQMVALLFAGSFVLFFMSIFFFLPIVVIFPAKFAVSFTFASIFFILAVALLRGFKTTFLSLLQREKWAFTISYILSLMLTLYASIGLSSYLVVILAIICQVVSLAYFFASFVPFGASGMNVITLYIARNVGGGIKTMFSSIVRTITSS
jgi:Got1/Sft2-like family